MKRRVLSDGGSVFSLYKYIFGAKSIKYPLKSQHCHYAVCVLRYLTVTAATLTESLAAPLSPQVSPFRFNLVC